MAKVPVFKPREVAAILKHLGFTEVRQRGSHKQFRHPDGRGTTVPFPLGSRYLTTSCCGGSQRTPVLPSISFSNIDKDFQASNEILK